MNGQLAYIGVGCILTGLYFIIGIGTMRLVSIAKKEKLSLFCCCFWIIVLCVFAVRGDIEI